MGVGLVNFQFGDAIMMLYICDRNNQCKHQCYNYCYYTTCFQKSKLYNNKIKPKDLIIFVKDKRGDFWEINQDWDKNLPESLRATPLTLIYRSYDQLAKDAGW